ncbi:hypothetical protein [Acinetobacter sp.]|uniref:hypothetical protein n=1 Tax=Acinetobacter sp. TaxID=472 RepID=UPI00388E7F5F
MLSIIVNVALATLCVISPVETQECYPVLIGGDTPKGEFQLQQRLTDAKGYGGDVLQFKEEGEEIFAIHRVWTLRPWEKRQERLNSPDPKMRRITRGCINVDPEIYEKLVDCCSAAKLTIE